MKTCIISELIKQNFNVVFINALQQFWRTTRLFRCIDSPKKLNLLLYLNGCDFTYTDKQGNTITAKSGDVVYTPIGSEYTARVSSLQSSDFYTVGINFLLYDELGESVVLSDKIEVFHNNKNRTFEFLFNKILESESKNRLIRNRITLMEILNSIDVDFSYDRTVPEYLKKCLNYMTEHIKDNTTVSELAGLCNVSEVYFRKVFKKHMGLSPLEYSNNLRLELARTYLEFGDVSVQEISDMLGYSGVSHFIKQFRERYKYSPLKYRKIYRSN